MEICEITSTPLQFSFAEKYGGLEKVPDELLHPAASHSKIPRYGQYSNLVKVITEEGIVGIGESFGLPNPKVTKEIIENVLAPILIGEDVMQTDYLWNKMLDLAKVLGRDKGFMMEAISGIDIALWDLKGKILKQPVYSLLGGRNNNKILAYASPIMFSSLEKTVEQAKKFVEEGFKAVKLKIGRTIRTDIEHVKAVRENIGPDVKLLLDANCAYNLREAIELSNSVEKYNIYWLEEPLSIGNVQGMKKLQAKTNLSLALGENHFSTADLKPFLIDHIIDVVMPNVGRAGGITGCKRIGLLAEEFNVDFSMHGVGSIISLVASLHTLSSLPNSIIYEYNQLLNPLRDELSVKPIGLSGGYLKVPDGNGLGIELDEKIVNKYKI